MLGSEIKQKRIQQLRSYSKWKCHVDEVFVKINGEHHYLWRAEKIVTARLRSYGAAFRDLGCPREQKPVVRLISAQKTHTIHSDEKGAQCSGSGKCEVCRNSPLSTPLFSIISIRIAVKYVAPISSKAVPLLFLSGVAYLQDNKPHL